VLGFTGLVALTTGVLFGTIPAIRATRVNFIPDLKSGPGAVRGGRVNVGLGQALVVSQIASSLVLLVGVGLLVRTLRNLKGVNPGFNPKHVLLLTVEPHLVGYKGARLVNLNKELLQGSTKFQEFVPLAHHELLHSPPEAWMPRYSYRAMFSSQAKLLSCRRAS
jgi:hypothetical protein